MHRIRTSFIVAALATTIMTGPITASAQEAAPATDDPLIIIGWQDDDGGPIYGHASDIQAINQARAQAQRQQVQSDMTVADMADGAQ
jgi:hypothetical protein